MNDAYHIPAANETAERSGIKRSCKPAGTIPMRMYRFLASTKLAMALLVVILCCCVAGVTVWRGSRAGEVIFGTIWFNALLVLLVVNVACCFFGRIWGRRVTLVSFGMILFHLSFVAILLAIAYNSLFYFRGNIRVTEGEVLASGDPQSYDRIEHGRFFSFSRAKGEIALLRMHAGYRLGGQDKRVAYEVEVGEPGRRERGLVYITHKLSHEGFEYFNDQEGYSLLVTMADRQGHELYGGHLPLQSFLRGDKSFAYGTGYKEGKVLKEGAMPFPPEAPRFAMQVAYLPSKTAERQGEALFQLYPLDGDGHPRLDKAMGQGKAPVGQPVAAGEYLLCAKEVRYWVSMPVRYEPGKPVVLASLWVGLAGMLITTVGRMRRAPERRVRSVAADTI